MTKSRGIYAKRIIVDKTIRLAKEEFGEYFCFHCNSYKPSSEFCKDKYNRTGIKASCKNCLTSDGPKEGISPKIGNMN